MSSGTLVLENFLIHVCKIEKYGSVDILSKGLIFSLFEDTKPFPQNRYLVKNLGILRKTYKFLYIIPYLHIPVYLKYSVQRLTVGSSYSNFQSNFGMMNLTKIVRIIIPDLISSLAVSTCTVKILKFWTSKYFAVIILKVEQDYFSLV